VPLLFGHIRFPTLHVIGENDHNTPPGINLELAAAFAEPVLVRHPGGHGMRADANCGRVYLEFLYQFADASRCCFTVTAFTSKQFCLNCARWLDGDIGWPPYGETDRWYCWECWRKWYNWDGEVGSISSEASCCGDVGDTDSTSAGTAGGGGSETCFTYHTDCKRQIGLLHGLWKLRAMWKETGRQRWMRRLLIRGAWALDGSSRRHCIEGSNAECHLRGWTLSLQCHRGWEDSGVLSLQKGKAWLLYEPARLSWR